MSDQVKTGPLYDKAVQSLGTYRSVAARLGNARTATQGKLDRRLEKLGEQISETLAQLTDIERSALTCWRDGLMPDTYEVDHDAITDRPYVSIRRIERVTEDFDAVEDQHKVVDDGDRSRLKAFVSKYIAEL